MQSDLNYIFANQDICYSYHRNVCRYMDRKESFKLIDKVNCIVELYG